MSPCAITTAKQVSCLICYQPNCLYRFPDLRMGRNNFVKQKYICFNCINSTSHKCTSSTRCKVPGYGKTHRSFTPCYTLLVVMSSTLALKGLTIPLKHTRVTKSLEQWSHLKHVYLPELQRKKISVLLGNNIQEAFIPLEVKLMNRLQSSLASDGAF